MKKRKLANTELELSYVCYGTGNFGERLAKEEAFFVLDQFVDAGGNFIDTANVYCRWVPGLSNSSEQIIGSWLKDRKAHRRVVVATKGGHYDFGDPSVSRVNEREIRRDLEESMAALQVDHLDFYWLHRDNQEMPVEEIIGIMEDLVREGRIRYYGASNYSRERMEEALCYAKKAGIQGFSAVSNQWSMAGLNPGGGMNEDPTLVVTDKPYYQWHCDTKMPLIPYSSAAQGFFEKLARFEVAVKDGRLLDQKQTSQISEGMQKAYFNERNFRIYEALLRLHQETGESLYSLSLAWLMHQPFQVFPVVSASRIEQLEQIIAAADISIEAAENKIGGIEWKSSLT